MTREEWKVLSPIEKCIKVAELTGEWENIKYDDCFTPNGNEPYLACSPKGDPQCRIGLPIYLNDLNAMREAEKIFGCELGAYEFQLDVVTGGGMSAVMASASERAEAFVLAMEPEGE